MRWYTLNLGSNWCEQVSEDGTTLRHVRAGRVVETRVLGDSGPTMLATAKAWTAELIEVGKRERW